MVETFEYDLYYKPNYKEISLLLIRVQNILRYKSKIYRMIRDFQGCMKDKNKVINALTNVCKTKYNIGRLSVIMFYLYVTIDIDYLSKDLDVIKDFLRKNNCIYDENIKEYDFYAKFDNMYDAVSWILCYRATKIYFKNNLRKINEK